jgi:hypothetical protein
MPTPLPSDDHLSEVLEEGPTTPSAGATPPPRAFPAPFDLPIEPMSAAPQPAVAPDADLPPMPQRPSRTVQPKDKLTSGAWLMIIILLLLLGSGAAYAYYRVVLHSPAAVVAQAIFNVGELTAGTVVYETQFSVVPTTGTPSAAAPLTFRATAHTDFVDAGTTTNLSTDLVYSFSGGTIETLFGQGSVRPTLSFVTLSGTHSYLKLTGAPSLPFLDLTKIDNQWIALPETNGANATTASPLPVPTVSQAEVANQLRAAYKAEPFLRVQHLGNEKIDTTPVDRFGLSIDNKRFAAFVERLSIGLKTKVDMAALRTSLEGTVVQGYALVSTKDKLLRRIELTATAPTTGATVEFKFNGDLQRPNDTTITVNAPSNPLPLQEALVRAQVSGDSALRPDDAKTITDIAAIQEGLEAFHLDQERYPFIVGAGNRLGIDVGCLTNLGFVNPDACRGAVKTYIAQLPSPSDAPVHTYRYYLCRENDYILEYYLYNAQGDIPAGINHLNYYGATTAPEQNAECVDADNDGLSLYFEQKYGTDPLRPDTDADGYLDANEVANGFNPKGAGKL